MVLSIEPFSQTPLPILGGSIDPPPPQLKACRAVDTLFMASPSRRVAGRHTLMVGPCLYREFGDCFVEHPRQTGTYDRDGLWHGHDSAP